MEEGEESTCRVKSQGKETNGRRQILLVDKGKRND